MMETQVVETGVQILVKTKFAVMEQLIQGKHVMMEIQIAETDVQAFVRLNEDERDIGPDAETG